MWMMKGERSCEDARTKMGIEVAMGCKLTSCRKMMIAPTKRRPGAKEDAEKSIVGQKDSLSG
jgi:hypothetical protein